MVAEPTAFRGSDATATVDTAIISNFWLTAVYTATLAKAETAIATDASVADATVAIVADASAATAVYPELP